MRLPESQEIERVSKALWIPLLWLLMSASRGRISPERLGDLEVYEGNPTMRLFFSILILLGVLVLFHRNVGLKTLVRRNPWVVVLFLLMGVSVLYSGYPWISLKRWIKTIGVLVMALVILSEREPIKAFEWLIRRFAYVAAPLSFFLIIFLPQYGIKYWGTDRMMWVGISTHKNTLGLTMLICAAYFTWLLFFHGRAKRSGRDIIVFAISLFLLIACGSMTSLFAYFAMLGTLMLSGFGKNVRRHIGPVLAFAAVTALVAYALMEVASGHAALTNNVVESFGRNTTFTGRMELWTAVWGEAIKRPVFGHGFGGFWAGEFARKIWEVHDWKPIDSHNGYLDIFNELGLVGLIVTALMMLSTCARISRGFAESFTSARFFMALFVMVLVHNLNETSLLNLNHPYWFLFLFMALLVPEDMRAPETEPVADSEPGRIATEAAYCPRAGEAG
jgi:O-antigen ligase